MKKVLPFLIILISFSTFSFAQAGTLDSSFGINGQVLTSFSQPEFAFAPSNAIQKDGKILVTAVNTPDINFTLLRFESTGNPDSAFGINGKVTTHFDVGVWGSIATSVILQPDGKIIEAGYIYSESYFALVRFLPNGSIDYSFGNNGKVLTYINDFIAITELHTIRLQTDGKILAGGSSFSGSHLFRYLPNGVIDSAFGVNGSLNLNLGYRINDLQIQNDGKIIVASNHWNAETFKENFAIYRLLTNGNFDSTFGNNGEIFTDFPVDATPFSLGILKDGSIIVGGISTSATLVKYKSTGLLDSSFAINGVFKTVGLITYKVLIQNDDKIIGASLYGYIFRLQTNGLLDSTFGINGIESINSTSLFSAALQGDGKIVATGLTGINNVSYITVARFKGDPSTISIKKNISIKEGNTGLTAAVFQLVLNKASTLPVQVKIKTIDGTAINGTDYNGNSATLTIKPGKLSAKVTVNIIGDVIREPNETFSLVISDPVNATLGDLDTATCVIKNDDAGFAISNATEDELNQTNGIKVYPNPVKDNLQIEGLLTTAKTILSITDISGNRILSTTVTGSNYNWHISKLKPGSYILEIISDGKIITRTFIKQ
ncbi:MAG TPA: Calx-beta domain-containing protein [Panacibacter sp.]|nr:Calx-beta domain-containing protein [Panacibacter sp.]